MLRAAYRQLRTFLQLTRARGHGRLRGLLLELPLALAARGWRAGAGWVNSRVLAPALNPGLLRRFHRGHSGMLADHFYVIVMPDTLHYLAPCLRQLPESVPVILLFNGAARWERRWLRREFPGRPAHRLRALPRSSISHGGVISLLLRCNEGSFGLLDHDLYVFDPGIFQRLSLREGQCMKAVFRDTSQRTGLVYPHTWFLFLNAPLLRDLMRRHRVSARIYRREPARLRRSLAVLGLGGGTYLKDYLDFFDTLQLLLALAWSEGAEVAWEEIAPGALSHLGGTSIGSLGTKDLGHLYMSLRFLEAADDAELREHYLPRHAPFTASLEIRARLPQTPEVADMLRGLDDMLSRLARD